MTSNAGDQTSSVTGLRAAILIVVWLVFAFLLAPSLGLYYEVLAAWLTLLPLGLVYAYCLTHRSRSTVILAVVATVTVVVVIGFAAVFPKGSAA